MFDIAEKSVALAELGAMLGWDVVVNLENEMVDATTFGSTSKAFLVGEHQLRVSAHLIEDPRVGWGTSAGDPEMILEHALELLMFETAKNAAARR